MIPITGNMIVSMLATSTISVISGSAFAGVLLIFYMMSNEIIKVNKTKEEIRSIFLPLIVTLFIVFALTLVNRILRIG